MKEPRDFARSISQFTTPDDSGDRFSGYAVIGLPFSLGQVLALWGRRVFGRGSVWHREPNGRWT
ncbi:MAG TPA: hypothetical protein VFO27_19990, partial [Bryobacteraceae bacterium]|nr:hypothetical protein [Bryobacteraceae bacterium]